MALTSGPHFLWLWTSCTTSTLAFHHRLDSGDMSPGWLLCLEILQSPPISPWNRRVQNPSILVPAQLWWIPTFVLQFSWFLIMILIQECNMKQTGNQGKETACVYLKHFLKLNSQCTTHEQWSLMKIVTIMIRLLLKSREISFVAIDEILFFGQI